MDKRIWLVGGHKGGVGKSAVCKALVEWLEVDDSLVRIADGDVRTPDVARTFADRLETKVFDLQDEGQWGNFADWACARTGDGHIVLNLPDGVTERMAGFIAKSVKLVESYGFSVKALFVLNTLPDGLELLPKVLECIPELVAVKNLHFGRANSFAAFDSMFGEGLPRPALLFPAMQAAVMRVVRESGLAYSDFTTQTGDAPSNFLYGKIVVADWLDAVMEVFDDGLVTED